MREQKRRREAWKRQLSHARTLRRVARQFGIEALKAPPKAVRERAREVRNVIDAFRSHTKMTEHELFRATYPFEPRRADTLFWRYIREVDSCPQEVLERAEHLLREKHALEISA